MNDQDKHLVNTKHDSSKCPICHRVAELEKQDYENIVVVDCEYCGSFVIKGWKLLKTFREKQKPIAEPDYKMSIVLRNLGRGSGNRIVLSKNNYDEIRQSIRIPSNPYEILDLLLTYCSNRTTRFNRGIFIPYSDITLLYIHNDDEMRAMLKMASELEYMSYLISPNKGYNLELKIKGLEKVVQLREQRSESKKVFVAMKFGDEVLDEAYRKAIVPAVKNCGYNALRVDKVPHNDKICDRIISEIKQSAFVIADFTGHRGGVYFEAGYALGLGIPVVFTCSKKSFKKTHFDTRQYNHIIWESDEELRVALEDRINATIVKRQIV
ncbi:MAG: hypothetical protein ACOYIS_05620 [Candidatus Cloacimonadaceae bacterium]|jgi:nucleoside 2-deoxyribosyltransferase